MTDADADAQSDTMGSGRGQRINPWMAAFLDVAWVLIFVAIGRNSHTEGVTLAGVAETAWPFLVGLALGWAVIGAWRRPALLVPTGLVVWPVCVGVAMALRTVSGQGAAIAFVVVALVFVGLGLMGWRTAVTVMDRRRPRNSAPGA